MLVKSKVLWEYIRPFTLLAPMVGFLSGGLIAFGKTDLSLDWSIFTPLLIGAIGAALLNAAGNGLNQYYDVEIDKINKPKRPLPSSRLTPAIALGFTIFLYVISLTLSWFINLSCFLLFLSAALLTCAYSAPPLRTKRYSFLANFTIAIPRGILLMVAGWASLLTILSLEPWYIGIIFGLFLLGAATTKDFSDMKGDRQNDCNTLPIKYGIHKSALIISPFFILPWIMIPLGATINLLTGKAMILIALGFLLAIWGGYSVYLILREPGELATVENHVSWKHMYLMLIVGQAGFAMAYLL